MGTSHLRIAIEMDGEQRRAVVVGEDGSTLLNRVVEDPSEVVRDAVAKGGTLVLFEEPAALGDHMGFAGAARAAGAGVAYVPGAAARWELDFAPGRPREVGRRGELLARDAREHPELLRALEPGDTEETAALIAADRTEYATALRYLGQLHMFLEQRYPAVATVLAPHLDHPVVLELLERYATPDDMRAAGRRRLRGALRRLPADAADTLNDSLMEALARPESHRDTANAERVIPNRAHLLLLSMRKRAALSDDFAALLPPRRTR